MSDLARTVEALLFLSPDPVSVADLSEATEATEGQVAEAIELLSEDLAEGKRGIVLRLVGGGFTLARPPQSITLGEVVRTLEGEALVECFREDGGACVLTPRCRLKVKLAAAREAFLRELDATTLAECAYPSRPQG